MHLHSLSGCERNRTDENRLKQYETDAVIFPVTRWQKFNIVIINHLRLDFKNTVHNGRVQFKRAGKVEQRTTICSRFLSRVTVFCSTGAVDDHYYTLLAPKKRIRKRKRLPFIDHHRHGDIAKPSVGHPVDRTVVNKI